MATPGSVVWRSRGFKLLGCLLLFMSASVARSGDATWTNLRLPFDREQHAAIYDPIRDRIVVFGGDTDWEWDSDVWVLPLSGPRQWTKLTTVGTPPSHRIGHSAIYDPLRDRVLVFGGSDYDWQVTGTNPYYNSALNDVWSLSLSGTPTWSPLSPAGTPPIPRVLHTAIYDPVRDRMVVYGGWGAPGGFTPYISDAWALSLSGTPAWTQILPSGSLPPARYGHAAIYDPPRDRMVVFGGFSAASSIDPESNDVWALSFSGTPAWSDLSPSGTRPDVRTRATAIYDPIHDTMLVMGGEFDPVCNICDIYVDTDAWALSLSGAPAWTKVPLPAPGRTEHAAIFDPVRSRMLVVGGWYYGVKSEVWALTLPDPRAWSLVTDTQPTDRYLQLAIYDSARDRMVMYGGSYWDFHQQGVIQGYTLGDLWTLSLAGPPLWTRLAPVGTSPAGRESAIYDPVRDRMLVIGRVSSSSTARGVWALTFSGAPAWSTLTVSGVPPSDRSRHAAVYDPVRDRVVIVGGPTGSTLNDVWELSLSGTPTWNQLVPSGTPPSGRAGHTAVYDPVGDRIVVFGGSDAGGRRNDAWGLSLSGTPAWSEIAPAGVLPAPREGHSAIYDPMRSHMVVFGGTDATSVLDDVWALSLSGAPSWVDVLGAAAQRVARSDHSAIYDPMLDRMVMFAGADGVGFRSDLWALNFGGPTPTLASLISARAYRDRVELAWQVGPGGASTATIYRRAEPGTWQALAAVTPDGMGRVMFVDRDVTPGTRYGYRIGITGAGQPTFAGETWVEIPTALDFALLGGRPNPSSGRLSAWFTLPAARPAMLELWDVSGRRIAAREVGSLGAGEHTVDLTPRQALPPGVYLLRLTQGERTSTMRAAVLK